LVDSFELNSLLRVNWRYFEKMRINVFVT